MGPVCGRGGVRRPAHLGAGFWVGFYVLGSVLLSKAGSTFVEPRTTNELLNLEPRTQPRTQHLEPSTTRFTERPSTTRSTERSVYPSIPIVRAPAGMHVKFPARPIHLPAEIPVFDFFQRTHSRAF